MFSLTVQFYLLEDPGSLSNETSGKLRTTGPSFKPLSGKFSSILIYTLFSQLKGPTSKTDFLLYSETEVGDSLQNHKSVWLRLMEPK